MAAATTLLRWLVRIIVILLATLALGILTLLVVNSHDEALLAEAAAALQEPPAASIAPADNLFFNLLGFSSSEGSDQNLEGQRIFGLYQQAAAKPHTEAELYDVYKLAGVKTLEFVGNRQQLCSLGVDPGPYRCIAAVAANRAAWEKALGDNDSLLKRYRQLPEQVRYRNLFPPDQLGPAQRWSNPAAAKRLLLASWALSVDRGELDPVIAEAVKDTAFWRAFLGLQNLTLVDKMMAVAMVRSDLLFIGELLHSRPLSPQQYEAVGKVLAPLDTGEKSMKPAFDAEFRFAVTTLKQYVSRSALRDRMHSGAPLGERLLDVLTYVAYQPNATANRIYRGDHPAAWMGEYSCNELRSDSRAADAITKLSFRDYLYNPSGNILAVIGIPSFTGYVGRICDLEGLRRVVALQLNLHDNAVPESQIPAYLEKAGAGYADPYTLKPMQWSAPAHGLSFKPSDSRFESYLPWPI
jgi:hypothetical protein